MENFLFSTTPYLFKGLLLWFTSLILVLFSYVFIALFLQERINDFKVGDTDEFSSSYKAIVGTYLACVFLALWALLTTYFVGPGYCSDHFKSVKLDPIDMNISANAESRDPKLSSSLQSDDDLKKTHMIYLKSDYEKYQAEVALRDSQEEQVTLLGPEDRQTIS